MLFIIISIISTVSSLLRSEVEPLLVWPGAITVGARECKRYWECKTISGMKSANSTGRAIEISLLIL